MCRITCRYASHLVRPCFIRLYARISKTPKTNGYWWYLLYSNGLSNDPNSRLHLTFRSQSAGGRHLTPACPALNRAPPINCRTLTCPKPRSDLTTSVVPHVPCPQQQRAVPACSGSYPFFTRGTSSFPWPLPRERPTIRYYICNIPCGNWDLCSYLPVHVYKVSVTSAVIISENVINWSTPSASLLSSFRCYIMLLICFKQSLKVVFVNIF